MTKATLERIDEQIRRRRKAVTQLHAELEDLEDYVDVLEARRQSLGKRTYAQGEMKRRYAAT